MAKSAQREAVRELVRLVRLPEEGGYNLGPFLAANANELAPVLSIAAKDLEAGAALPDEVVARRLTPHLEQARTREQNADATRALNDATAAADQLARSVRWQDGEAHLDAAYFFSRAIWRGKNKYVRFVADDFDVAVSRSVGGRTTTVLEKFNDVRVHLDCAGLHLRWRSDRGRLNLRPAHLEPVDRAAAVVVVLPPAQVVTTARAHPPSLLGDVLLGLGYL